VSRFTISVLLATALLGVLLWIVLSIVIDLANPPDELLPLPDETPIEFNPALPRINSEQEFSAWFAELGYDFTALSRARGGWDEARGNPAPYSLAAAASPASAYWEDGPDDAQLLLFAAEGDLQAMNILAVRSLMRDQDPLEALAWYDRSIVSGSIYAMLAVADLTMTLTDPALEGLRAQPEWEAAVAQLRNESPPPTERALAWSLAAVIMGGYGMLNENLARRIATISAQLDTAGIDSACETAQDYVLDVAATRRAQGGAVFSFEQPPFSITLAEPETIIPCDAPMEPLVTLAGCARHDFVENFSGPEPLLQTAWVCSN
jgi:hypothetical protein